MSVADPTRPPLRAAVLFAVAAMAAVAAALAVAFWAVLEPVRGSGCNTTLPAGAFRDALGPAHADAAVALGAVIGRLDVRRCASGRARLTTRIAPAHLTAAWASGASFFCF